MKSLFLKISILTFLFISCNSTNKVKDDFYVSKEIMEIIDKYSNENELKLIKGNDSIYLSKQSYELSFFRNENDTLMYIGRVPFYSNDIFFYANNSSIIKQIGLENKDFIKNPTYMGTFLYKTFPVHIYDIRDKIGKKEYNFNNLSVEDFKDYLITEPFIRDTMASFWIYKIKNHKFELYKKTEPFKYM